jgi:hypothetical protein
VIVLARLVLRFQLIRCLRLLAWRRRFGMDVALVLGPTAVILGIGLIVAQIERRIGAVGSVAAGVPSLFGTAVASGCVIGKRRLAGLFRLNPRIHVECWSLSAGNTIENPTLIF